MTFPNLREAERISEILLSKNLIACSNIFEGKSLYKWKGKIQNEPEVFAFAKSIEQNWQEIKEVVTKEHPYEVPCIVSRQIDSNEDYEEWVIRETHSPGIHS